LCFAGDHYFVFFPETDRHWRVIVLFFEQIGAFMNRRLDEFLHKALAEALAMAGICWSVVLILICCKFSLWKPDWLIGPQTGVLMLAAFSYLRFSKALEPDKHKLAISRAVWNYSMEFYPILRLFRGCYTVLVILIISLSIGLTVLSMWWDYCILTDVGITVCLKAVECLASCGFTLYVCSFMTALATIGAVLYPNLVNLVSTKLQNALEHSTDPETIQLILAKLTTIELYRRDLLKADVYSRHLVSLAETHK